MAFRHRIRVRYAETDAQGVAHHSAYVAWLEEARIEALREIGHSYRSLEADGIFMPVTGLELRYRRAAHFDDVLEIRTTVAPEGRFQFAFISQLLREGEELASGTVRIACLDAGGGLRRFPDPIKEALLERASLDRGRA